MKETLKNLKNVTKIVGASTLLAAGVAAPAKAQTGGSQAPTLAATQDGGTVAPAEASTALEDQAEQAEATVANQFMKLENGSNTSPAKSVPNIEGDALSETTITVPAKNNQGKYKFDIKTDDQGANGPLQPGSVVSVKATEIAKGQTVPEASVMIDQNPGTNTAEISGTYQMTGPNDVAAKNQKFDSFSAQVESVSPTVPVATSYDISATKTQMLNLALNAEAGKPTHNLEPAANTTTGATINGPQN